MADSYDLTKLGPDSFEHLVNFLALRVLGAGTTGFSPGSDGGRDGFFEGEASYPSDSEHWSGRWYIQSKFMKPHLSTNPQKWLLEQIKSEIKAFKEPKSKRQWPNNWIIATNIDPSGVPETGAFDRARKLVESIRPKKQINFHIWGGRKILDFLAHHPEARDYYGHFLTPGHVLKTIYDQLNDAHAEVQAILEHLTVNQFSEHLYTKLDQAGSSSDSRPGIHQLFIDLPFHVPDFETSGMVTECLSKSSSQCHRFSAKKEFGDKWRRWSRHPSRARVLILKGGPGQGKSTIGQYFSQIQRAALILEKNGPRVIPRLKQIANEIRDITNSTGLWPTVPRIPIAVELKEFAQWYGQRNGNQARGVLTYLAERIGSKVEQKVLPGTLKRALGLRSWFIVFDGLDEVPNDVKDAVAAEIIKFVDELVIQVDGDVLTLCTSRPQGYSGQFSIMDGPVTELVNLSPDAALRCAEPVISLDRSADEAKKSMEILRAAIASRSVRELMTTPLQAHIMAVVVRDGGRPPERRWQLFDNFYQVMKKRESLKNFPDPRVAKLLREDDKLLKSIHCRLGFTLHARAESSNGAQTTLNRAEFRTLATQTASHLIEQDVESTVDVLMEATTERLVFVSTPESGDHVRFDIRQLQEFFAAEFLYDRVTVDELRARIELIVGDAHWREVMHFLLSALIENGRTAELSVAIEALNRLNEGDENCFFRTFQRRMCKGALLGSRLLIEGVLEQDRRIRQQFRQVLEPIYGLDDVDTLNALVNIAPPNSRTWLTNAMIDAFLEGSESETVGAAIVLAQILPDDHLRTSDVKRHLMKSSAEFRDAIFSSFVANVPLWASRREIGIGNLWFIEATLEFLTRPDWSKMAIESLNGAMLVLRNNMKQATIACKKLGFSKTHSELLSMVLDSDKVRGNNRGSATIDFGMIKGQPYKYDWTSGSFPQTIWPQAIPPDAISAPGFLEVTFRILRFGKTRKYSDFRAACDCISATQEHVLQIVPGWVLALVPLDDWSERLASRIVLLSNLSESEFELLLTKKIVKGRMFSRPSGELRLDTGGDLKHWLMLVEQLPKLAIQLWFDDTVFASERPNYMDKGPGLDAVIGAIEKNPEFASRLVLCWGRLFKFAPDREERLKNCLISALIEGPVEATYWMRSAYPFRANTERDLPILPWLAQAFVDLDDPTARRFAHPGGDKAGPKTEDLVRGYGLTPQYLTTIAEQPTTPQRIRAGALILYLRHASIPDETASQFLEKWKPTILQLYGVGHSVWYLKGIKCFFERQTVEMNPQAALLIGELFELAREDFPGRRALQDLLSSWRERSFAPIQKANILDRWMAN